MKGSYEYIIDGYAYICPECGHKNNYALSDEECDKCDFKEEYVDPDEWLESLIESNLSKRKSELRLKIIEIVGSEKLADMIMGEIYK